MDGHGSTLTNKYAEGLPGKRDYGGCEYVDLVEELAIQRAKDVFGAEHVNVQPHAGALGQCRGDDGPARPGDSHPGHATGPRRPSHDGMRLNFSGKLYDVVAYGVLRL